MMKKARAEELRSAWLMALQDVAKACGYDRSPDVKCTHPTVVELGGIAWGRFELEASPGETKDQVLRGLGYLQGMRDACMRSARLRQDQKTDRLLCKVPGIVQRRVYG